MGAACTIKPHVRNSKGEVVESRLFNDLLHYTSDNRELSKEYYNVGIDERFLSKARESDKYQEDENGEITFNSLRVLSNMDLEMDKLLKVLNKDLGEGEYGYDEALAKIEHFNQRVGFNDKVLATMYPSSKGKYFITVVPQRAKKTEKKEEEGEVEVNTSGPKEKLFDVVKNEEKVKRIKALLRGYGVSVKFIEKAEKGGRYSTENATKMEDGLYGLIEVNEYGQTSEVLAEEAGHFAIGALGDNPLVKRLEDLLSDPAMQKEALGDEEFENANLGDNPAREVGGRLVGKALNRKLENNAPYRILANRIANIAKRVFYRITGNQVRWAAAKAEQIANRVAYGFAEGKSDFSVDNARNIKETMRSTSLTVNQKVYRDTIDELGRMCKALDAIADDAFARKVKGSMGNAIISGTDAVSGMGALQMDGAWADVFAFDGIVQALVQLTDYLGTGHEIDQMMASVNLDNPSDFYAHVTRNAKCLRQVRTFLRSAGIMVNYISEYLDSHNLGGTITAAGSTSIEDVRYQDDRGNWKTINVKKALEEYKALIATKQSDLSVLESAYFARFCEDVYGSKYITRSAGLLWRNIWQGTNPLGEDTHTIASMIDGEGVDDIDIMHRYIGSMANNPDVIGQIADKIVKTANKSADDKTIEYQEKLMILQQRAEDLGLDVKDLMELDENGVPTGNMIMPPASPTQNGNEEEDFIYEAYMKEGHNYVPCVDYGRWERERKQFNEDLWEKFKTKNPDWKNLPGFTRGFKWDEFKRKEMKRWNAGHSIKVEVRDSRGEVKYVKWVPGYQYEVDSWDKLMQKYPKKQGDKDSLERWYYDYRKLKKELDSLLPVGATTSYRLPQFKGTFANSVRQSMALEKGPFKRFNAWRKTFGRRVILESFVETAEDEEFGSLHTMNSPEEELLGTKLNYEEERAARLPIFGINKLTNMKDLSSDIFCSTLAYASMATSYAALNDVVHALEVGRMALYNRNLRGKEWSAERGARKIGNKIRKWSGDHELYQEGSKNRAYGRYIKFLENQVYGITATHLGIPIWKGKRLLLHKVIRNLSSLGGTLFLKGNVLGGSVNTLTGTFNVFKEAMTGEYFDAKDWSYAHKYYFKHFFNMWGPMWGDLGKLKKTHKLGLFLEEMNFQGNNDTNFRNWRTSRSRLNNFYRMVGYLPYSSGDHYMQAMSYLSIAHGTKLYNTDGSFSTNLWDAFNVEENSDEFGNFKAGKTLNFSRFCPLEAGSITSELIDRHGVYLKKIERSVADFEEWIVQQDPQFADSTYKATHGREYNSYRDAFDNSSDEELMQKRSERYEMLADLLKKAETSTGGAAPLLVLTQEQMDFLNANNVDLSNQHDILQVTRNSIYRIIWTKADESTYMDRCRELNNRMHGIYNQQDKTAWHQQWYTNAFLAMKGWALGYLEMMYSPNHYSVALGRNVEGFVNTAGKIPLSVILGSFHDVNHLGWKDMLLTMFNPWSKRSRRALLDAGFSEDQSFNARRMAMSTYLILALLFLRWGTAPPDKEEKEAGEEMSVGEGLIYYLASRTMLEQEAFLWPMEAYKQGGQLLDFMPVGGAALFDLATLAEEMVGAATTGTDSKYYYHQDDPNGRYSAEDPKYENHWIRITPYLKSWWGLQHPYEAWNNYEFGRKLRAR